jgi:hypothetical protein
MKCPPRFKYLQGSGGDPDKCVHETNNAYTISLQAIPINASGPAFTEERNRIAAELQDIQARQSVPNELSGFEAQYNAFQTRYAGYKSMQDNAKMLDDTAKTLKPMRPETAPGAAIAEEQRKILRIKEKDLRIVQVALITVLVALVMYLILPASFAHGLAFLIVCGGIGLGIFLWTDK